MKMLKRGWWGALAAGLLLLVWGATSAFSNWRTLQALTPDALDNPQAPGSQWIMPTLAAPAAEAARTSTPFRPGQAVPAPGGAAGTAGAGQPGSADALPTADPNGDSQIFSVPVSNTPLPTPQTTQGMMPERIVIPAIHLNAPIEEVPYRLVKDDTTGMVLQQWSVPDKFAVGWQANSALLGVKGNTVLDGHHNVYGQVFRYLVDLVPGQIIEVTSGKTVFTYAITNKMILRERNEPLSVRFANARWLLPSNDQRITLVTCWPYTSNTHRLIIVAVPIGRFSSPAATGTGRGALP